MAASKVLYAKTVEDITGVLKDIVRRTSPTSGKTYLELVFASGETIAMPEGFRVKHDLCSNVEYHAKWEDGKFTIVPTSVEGEQVKAI